VVIEQLFVIRTDFGGIKLGQLPGSFRHQIDAGKDLNMRKLKQVAFDHAQPSAANAAQPNADGVFDLRLRCAGIFPSRLRSRFTRLLRGPLRFEHAISLGSNDPSRPVDQAGWAFPLNLKYIESRPEGYGAEKSQFKSVIRLATYL